jgi:hypothetical protein
MSGQTKAGRWRSRTAILAGVVVVAVLAAGGVFLALDTSTSRPAAAGHLGTSGVAGSTAAATTSTTSTTSTTPPPTTPTTAPAAPGFIPGKVTAVGDSVMLDYQDPLEAAIPGIDVAAAVSRQWGDGESILQTMKADGQLGAEVIVALGTNGPITDADFDAMMSILSGASRVVFVNVHVDRPWQDPNNAVIAQGATRYPNVVVADWATLAAQNPQWFGPDGTHLAIDGPGADALAALVASTLVNG